MGRLVRASPADLCCLNVLGSSPALTIHFLSVHFTLYFISLLLCSVLCSLFRPLAHEYKVKEACHWSSKKQIKSNSFKNILIFANTKPLVFECLSVFSTENKVSAHYLLI